jgi:hypothetical protein
VKLSQNDNNLITSLMLDFQLLIVGNLSGFEIQKKVGFGEEQESQLRRKLPSANTISASNKLSMVRPYFRQR